ncbi:sulfate ABC transporter permease subunit CysW [Nodosilinea sp. PGN35]|uniref:sulfate ABC transporter permease subunit CysW n=1 Tax=Nodosilinea sp. PGN35 TaxID=3020489 RepID=UPI0023B29AD4|nr:sulfate ABC transporter permease subunit CysW [Nodosilinea sp. TSF1-S3]MDF0368356.1 sulfate ABC transporter permease subunit CysW [Nodosilinea sp. TSF1-S3]
MTFNLDTQAPAVEQEISPKAPQDWAKIGLILLVFAFFTVILIVPVIYVFVGAFSNGLPGFLGTLSSREFLNALRLTLMAVAVAVPLNVIFGLCAALVLARKSFRGRTFLLSVIDLPFSISPVVAGLMLVSLYGRQGLLNPVLQALDLRIIFAFPGIALATILGGMPFVAREVIPVLEEIGDEEEEAAKTLGASSWQTFWRVTLPAIRWALGYGIILTTARAMGEFGSIAVVSSNLIGRTQTLTLFVDSSYRNYDSQGAFATAVVLAGLAAFTLVIKQLLEHLYTKRYKAE